MRARLIAGDLDLFLATKDGFLETNGHPGVNVLSPARCPAGGCPSGTKACEKALKEVIKSAKTEIGKVTEASALQAGMAKAVIGRSSLRIGEHFIGLVDLFEFGLGVGALVDVGMVLAGQPSESLLYFIRAS
jgi:hypothetical protein